MTYPDQTRIAAAFDAAARSLRLRAGLSQTEVARRLGIARPNYGRVERGRHVPSMETLIRLAMLYEIPPPRLLATILDAGGRAPDEDPAPVDVAPEKPAPRGEPEDRRPLLLVEAEHQHRGFSTWEALYLTRDGVENMPLRDQRSLPLRARMMTVLSAHPRPPWR